jgi:LPS-assembly protein
MPTFAPFPRALLVTPILLAALAAGAAEPPREKEKAPGLPPGVELTAEHISQDKTNGSIVADGAVTIVTSVGRIQADRIVFREGHIVEADGNVLVVWGENRISGTSMVYDMGIKDDPDPKKRIARGVIEHAIGQVEPEFYFEAERVDTIGQDRVVLHKATVTTCTQPVPYWSFMVSTAKIKLEGYAHMFNLRPRIGKVPIFYLPYLAWPVKRDRAVGLLFPEFGSTRTRGRVVSIPLFVPLGPSADITLFGEYYTIAGWGGGAKLRLVPNRDGYAEAQAHYIQDQVTGQGRYQVQVKQTQSFLNGFRMVSDIDLVSDFGYFSDFERNLTYASSPTILGRLSFTRSGSWTSLLVQEQYREQLFSDASTLVQTTLPQVQWRGRSKKLGKSPLYFSYISSFTWINQNGPSINADYWRADLAPTLSLPLSPAPWLDITPTVALRSTYWSEHQVPPTPPSTVNEIVSEGLMRNLLGASVEFSGPRFFRIFEKVSKDGKRKIKNTVEPKLTYTYQQAFDKSAEVINYDEVDPFGVNANAVTFGIASRVIAQRPRAATDTGAASGEKILIPDSASGQLREAPVAVPNDQEIGPTTSPGNDASQTAGGAPTPVDATAPLEPIEVASIEMSETYAFKSFPSQADVHGDCAAMGTFSAACNETSHFSTLSLTGRYNPSRNTSFNLTGRYDVLFKSVSEVTLSGNFRNRMANGLFSLVYHPGLGYVRAADPDTGVPLPADPVTNLFPITGARGSSQLRFQGNFGPFAGRLRLGMDATANFNPAPGTPRVPYQRWRLEYYTQCCGFLTEYLINDYTAIQRREFRFAIDLRGIGKLFDFNQGIQ